MSKERLFERFITPLLIISVFFFLLTFIAPTKKEPTVQAAEALKVSYLDVGQGDSTYLATNNINILIDGGPDKSILSSLASVDLGIKKKIDFIFLTHPHADHLAGLNYLFSRYEIGKIMHSGVSYQSPDYRTFLQAANSKNLLRKTYAGKNYQNGELNLTILWPRAGHQIKDVNDTSIAILVTYKERRFLFLGDLNADIQDTIAKDYELPDIDVIKVAHHGSKNGLSESLLQETRPEYAVISVGKNSYGHPSQLTLAKLRGLKVLRTDLLGTIIFITDGKELFLKN